ncbi:hypothetical protein AB835_13370 [Candidatus Endobugula sertula]|uniref:Uncharacterized protein n=1 Tax=Candidatus Endobugula sertula TaxID=62101 RepID=A0A1D2QLZ9_9GAMM|nr:hypothetical protein AB835_13370 [Candidatus Endobugula sertula]
MSVKNTAATLVGALDDNATWVDVKNTIMNEYNKETGDAKADAIAAIVLCAVFVSTCIFWISSQ